MVYSKAKKILFVLLCLFIIFFPFWCVKGLCAEVEDVEISSTNLSMSTSRNYFTSGSSSIGYFQLEKGYIYHITNLNSSFTRLVVVSDDLPAVNVSYTILTNIEPLGTYDYISNGDNVMYISYDYANQATVTREKIDNMSGTVLELANVVSPSAFWNIFDISINYIVIAVLVAFGIFIITRIIKKISKGKEGL